jgi:hypothetical protein
VRQRLTSLAKQLGLRTSIVLLDILIFAQPVVTGLTANDELKSLLDRFATMPLSISCPECTNEIPQPAERCPHCGRPGPFWNVIAAEEATERAALDRRYQAAKADAASRGAISILEDFENAVGQSQAVISRSEIEVNRLASGNRQLYATYYEFTEAGMSLPAGDQWDVLRELADTVLFWKSKKHIRFGALSLNGEGLPNYGVCSMVLRDEMICHRSSVFEENSAVFMERNNIRFSREPKLPKGYKAVWEDRGKLCVAKLAKEIDSQTGPDKYSGLLLQQGSTSENDRFVEVHIYGAMTVLTMEQVIVTAPKRSQKATILKAIKFKLAQHGVRAS